MSNQAIEKLKSALRDLSGVTPIDDESEELLSSAEIAIRAAIAQLEGNKNTELAEAMAENVRAFRHKETGYICYVLMGDDTFNLYEEVMIIPNISNAAIDAAMEAKHG